MKASTQPAGSRGFYLLATFVLVVAVMKIAETVLIPIALTILLTFLLTPLVIRLMRWGLPKPIAIIVTVLISLGAITGLTAVVIAQGVSLAKSLPDYEDNIREKLAAIRAPQNPEGLSRVTQMMRNVQKDLEEQPSAPAQTPSDSDQKQPVPVPVEVKERQPGAMLLVRSLVGPLLGPLGTAAIVLVFVVAMLFQREDLRDRFIKVISAGRLNLATQALDDAARRVTRYLLMQLVVNATYGVPIGVGLYLIGVPNALLWGVLATLLRFIPFLGPWIAAAFPVALAAAVDPGWSKLVYTLCLFVVMEVVSNNMVEPWLYGSSTGISNLALMIAAVFWTWVWGVPGLFLSTPLTVCIMVLGKHVPGIQFLSVMLGSEPGLDPAARFYQRMLSMDADGMLSLAERFIEEKSLEGFYNDVFIPALFMSEQDRHSGALAEVRQKFIFEASRELIEELQRRAERKATTNEAKESGETDGWMNEKLLTPTVFVIPARDDADEVVGLMLQHLLKTRGIETEVLTVTTQLEDSLHWIRQHRIPIALVSALPPAALFGARQLCRRLREGCPETRLIVGVWGQESNFADLQMRLRRPAPDAIATTMAEAVRQVEQLQKPEAAKAVGAQEEELIEPLSETAHGVEEPPALDSDGTEPEEILNAVTQDVARHFNIPVSLVSIVGADTQYWRSRSVMIPELSSVQDIGTGAQPISKEETVLVEDIGKDKRFSENALLNERGIKFYGSVPLRDSAGRLVGCLSIVDTKPRHIDEYDRRLLEKRAHELMEAMDAPSAKEKRKTARRESEP